ncbi:MAG: hypothetical protein QM703_14580 [Gemmatales bacterium]
MSKSASLPRIRSKARPASQRPRLVEHELERAQLRIRTVDSLYSISLLVGGILTYVLLIIALDYYLHLSDGTRQVLWSLAGVGALAFIGWRLVRPLVQKINPYYTARIIERATPGSKNGIINWLDLNEGTVSPIIRDALSRRAVHELDSANMEAAIPTRKPIRTAIIIGVILLGIIGFAFFIPDQVGSLFKRALFPFQPNIIPTHTRIEVLNPVVEPVPDVDVATLPIKEVEVERGQPVEFRVLTHGHIPAEVFLESQTAGDRQPVVKPLRQDKKDDSNQPWRVALSSSDIPVDGFTFWFRANDGLTRKFKLVVVSRTPPSVSDLDVRLNFPAYTKRRTVSQGMGPIKAIEGTKVDILVTADRPASNGELEVIEEKMTDDGKIMTIRQQTIKLVRPQGISDDNKLALTEPLWLIPGYFSKDDKKQKFFYQLTLISPENLTGTSPKYPLEVLPDLSPRVEIKKVKEIVLDKKQDEFEVEANAVVPIAGQAHDDIAMGQVALKLKTSDGRDLHFVGAPVEEKNLQKANGFTPPPVNFLLKLDMAKLSYDDDPKTAKPISLKPGTMVELIVEGTDTAEPKAHVGTSQLIKLKIKGEASPEERKNQEKKADDQQKQHDQDKKDKEQQQPENNQNQDKKDGDKGEQGSDGKGENDPNKKDGKQSDGKGENDPNKKDGKQSDGKGENDPNKKDGKQSDGKGENDPNKKDGKQSDGKGENDPNKKDGKQSDGKGENDPNKKDGKQSDGKGENDPNKKDGKQSDGKGENDPNKKDGKQSDGKGENDPNKKDGKQSDGKGENDPNKKDGKQSDGKGENDPNKKDGKQSDGKGENDPNKKDGKQSDGKGENDPNKKDGKQSDGKGENDPNKKDGKQSDGKGENDPNKKDGKQSDGKGENDPNKKDGKQSDGKGENDPNKKDGKQSDGKGENDPNKKDGKQSDGKGENDPNKKDGKQSDGKGENDPNKKDGKQSDGKGENDPNKKDGKQSDGKGENDPNKKDGKQSDGKGENDPNKKDGKQSDGKGENDPNKKDGKQSDGKGENDPNKKDGKQSDGKGENDPNKKDGKQSDGKGENDPNKKDGKQSDGKGENDPNKKDGKQSDGKGENDPNKKDGKQSDGKGENDPNKKDGKQSDGKGENDPNKKDGKQSDGKGENDPNKKDGKQSDGKGENDPNKKDGKQSDGKGENDPNKKDGKQSDGKGENDPNKKDGKQSDEKNDNPGNDKGQAGNGPGKDPNDKGDLGKLMEQVAKDNKKPEKTNFEAKAADGNAKKGQDVDTDAARKRELALDTLADKLRRGDIDRQLADKLKELKLTKEEALKLVQNQKTDRIKGSGKQADQLTGKSLTGVKQKTEQIIDPATDVPDELSSSYRSFTEKRNQPKK